MEELLDAITSSPMATNSHQISPDEILIDFLIENPCLWDKSDHDFRNRNLKDFKWKEVAGRMNMAAHEAIRRYKTLCERFRREMIKQNSIPNFISTWNLFGKFAALKDAQCSEDRKMRIKPEESLDIIDFATLAAEANVTNSSSSTNNKKRKISAQKNYCDGIDSSNEITLTNGCFGKMPKMYENNISLDDDNDTTQSMNVQPSFVGGSTDLSTDSIAAFCQFIEASLKQMPTDRSDDLIEDISSLLFRKKREFKAIDLTNEMAATPPSS